MSTKPLKTYSRLVSYFLFEGRPLTTRGRWINPLLAAHFALEKRLPQLRRVDKPIFILGTGRSGTTILGLVLSMHKDVGFLNEPKALWHSVNPADDLIGSYSSEAAKYRLDGDNATDEIRHDAHRLYGAYLACSLSNRIVDKYPEMLFRVPFLKSIFPDAKFLFLVRNGWAACRSIENWSARHGKHISGDTHDWWGADGRKWKLLVDQLVPDDSDFAPHADQMRQWTNQSDMAALEWILSMREGIRLMNRYPGDIFQVKYEQLCSRPRDTLAKILAYANLDTEDDKLFDYAEKILKPATDKEPFPLHPSIEMAFLKTKDMIGYHD